MSALYKMIGEFDTFIKVSDIIDKGIEDYYKGVDIFIKGFEIYNEVFYKLFKGFKDIFRVIDDTYKGIKKTSEGKFVASHHTRPSTFAIRTKAHRKPKIAKELVLFAPRMETFCHLETIDNQTNNK